MWYEQWRGWIERPFAGPLFFFGLTLFLAAWHVLWMSASRGQLATMPDKTGKLFGLLRTAVLCVLAVNVVDQIDRRLDSEWAFALKVASIGVAVAGSLLCLQFAFRPPDRATAAASARSVGAASARGVLLISLGAAAWAGCRFYAAAFPAQAVVDDSESQGGVCESKDFIGWTDRGREIRLYRMEGDPEGLDSKRGGRQSATDDYPTMAILRQSRNVRSNCHGWVFCDGRFVLPGDDIQRILEDNRYSVVEHPRAGDLILYREADGQFIHSGVVRGVLDDGTVMVESKWGVDRRYLHSACDQPYSQLFAYYRSPRQGHRLTITKVLPAELRLSPEDKRAIHSIMHVGPNAVESSSNGTKKESIAPARHG